MKTRLKILAKTFFFSFLGAAFSYVLLGLFIFFEPKIPEYLAYLFLGLFLFSGTIFAVFYSVKLTFWYPLLAGIFTVLFAIAYTSFPSDLGWWQYLIFFVLASLLFSVPGFIAILVIKLAKFDLRSYRFPQKGFLLVLLFLWIAMGVLLLSFKGKAHEIYKIPVGTASPNDIIPQTFRIDSLSPGRVHWLFQKQLQDRYFVDSNVSPWLFWEAEDGKIILLNTAYGSIKIGIPVKPWDGNRYQDAADYLKLDYVRNLQAAIVNTFVNNGFKQVESKNPVLAQESQNHFSPPGLTAYRFEKEDLKCGILPPFRNPMSWKNFIYLSIACSNSLKKDYEEQAPFIKDLAPANGYVVIEKRIGNFAIVNNQVALKRSDKWTIIVPTLQDYPSCSDIKKYQIPKEIIDRCFVEGSPDLLENTISAYD